MGWFSDFVSDPLGTVDQTVRNNVPGGWLGAAALGAGGYFAPEGSLSSLFGSTSAPEIGTGLETGMATTAPVTGGTVQATDLGTLASPNATTPAIMPSTVSSGSNLADVGTAGGPDNIDVGGGYNPATGYQGSTLASMMNGAGQTLSNAGDWIGKNPIPAIYGAGSLYDMYAKKQMANKQEAMYNQNRADIMNTYAPGSPEYNLMKQEMERKDAAAGRNSQYGTRANELAGKIAAYKTNALANMMGGQNTLANTAMGNQYGMFNTPLTLAALTATQK